MVVVAMGGQQQVRGNNIWRDGEEHIAGRRTLRILVSCRSFYESLSKWKQNRCTSPAAAIPYPGRFVPWYPRLQVVWDEVHRMCYSTASGLLVYEKIRHERPRGGPGVHHLAAMSTDCEARRGEETAVCTVRR